MTDRRSLTPEECAQLRATLDEDEQAAVEAFKAKEQRQADEGKLFGRNYVHGVVNLSCLMAVRIALATGARRGELCGITWGDVDFNTQQIRIARSITTRMEVKQPKTKTGTRTLYVDADTMRHLRMWKSLQASALLKVQGVGEGGEVVSAAQTNSTPVCSNNHGNWIEPQHFTSWWNKYRVKIGFPTLKLHELRHTQATLLLASGADIKTVQTRLGHKSANMTLDIYGHAMPANDKAAADFMGAVMGAAAKPKGALLQVKTA